MRLVYLTDTHIQSGRADNRKDNFLESIFNKLSEVISLCRQLKADFVIHGGDVFDNPRPDQKSMELFQWFLSELNLPVYCVAGNHDLIDQRLDSLEDTALGYLCRNQAIKLLDPQEKVYLNDGRRVLQLTGQHFYGGMDRQKNSSDYMIKKKECDLAVHVVHGMLLPRAFSDKVPCTLISEISGTEADFTLGAHAHLGYHEVVENKFFLNPGALARLTNLKKELVRIPQILYMDLNGDVSYTFIPLKSTRSGEEVMDIKELNENC